MHLTSREKPSLWLKRIRSPSVIAYHIKPARGTINWGSVKLGGNRHELPHWGRWSKTIEEMLLVTISTNFETQAMAMIGRTFTINIQGKNAHYMLNAHLLQVAFLHGIMSK